MRHTLLTIAVIGAVTVGLYVATLSQAAFECEACMEFDGRRECRTVMGPSREEAERGAVSNACALLTRGVTETVRCEGSRPARLECRRR